MKRVYRNSPNRNEIIINNRYISYYMKAKSLGYKTLWVGNGLICMSKGKK